MMKNEPLHVSILSVGRIVHPQVVKFFGSGVVAVSPSMHGEPFEVPMTSLTLHIHKGQNPVSYASL